MSLDTIPSENQPMDIEEEKSPMYTRFPWGSVGGTKLQLRREAANPNTKPRNLQTSLQGKTTLAEILSTIRTVDRGL